MATTTGYRAVSSVQLARAYSVCLAFTALGDWDRSRSFLQDTEYDCAEYFGYVLYSVLVSKQNTPPLQSTSRSYSKNTVPCLVCVTNNQHNLHCINHAAVNSNPRMDHLSGYFKHTPQSISLFGSVCRDEKEKERKKGSFMDTQTRGLREIDHISFSLSKPRGIKL